MIFWLSAIFFGAVFVFYLAPPLFASGASVAADDDAAGVLKADLKAIAAEEAAGLIGEAEAEEARLEAKRAALAAGRTVAAGTREAKSLRLASLAFIGLSPLFAAAVYFAVGAPEMLGSRIAEGSAAVADPVAGPIAGSPGEAGAAIAAMDPEERAAAIETMVAGLAARLEEAPEDVEGWRMLARSYAILDRPEDSAEAYRALLQRAPGTQEDWRGLLAAELALRNRGGGEVGAVPDVLAGMLRRFPNHPLALYQLGEEKLAAGAPGEAAGHWRALLAQLPEDAPIRPQLEARIAEAEAQAGGAEIAPDPPADEQAEAGEGG